MKKSHNLTIIFAIPCLWFCQQLSAQEKLHYWNESEAYLQDQASYIYEAVYKVLAAHPPGIQLGNERRLALASLDALLHDTRLDNGTAFFAYINQRYSNISLALQDNKPSGQEIRIFRLYNHGFIIQTSSVTLAVDMIRGGRADNSFVSDELIQSIVNQCDILFITHAHGDHADPVVAKLFYEQGKQVIVPEELWKNMDMSLRVLRGRNDMIQEKILIKEKNISLSVRVYPGMQENVLNNVYLITLPEGQTIMHTGDQDFSEDLAAKAGAQKINILFVQCWMMPMAQFVAGVNPELIITGHENEMLHSIDHRESYWLTFRRMSEIRASYVIMAMGESCKFR